MKIASALILLCSVAGAQEYRSPAPLTPVTHAGQPIATQEVGILHPFHRGGSQSLPATERVWLEPRGSMFPWNVRYRIRRSITPQAPQGCQPSPAPQVVPQAPGIRYDVRPPSIEYRQTLASAGRSDYWTWTPKAPHHRAAVKILCGRAGTTGVYVQIGEQTGVLSCRHGKPSGENRRIEFADGRIEYAQSMIVDKDGNDVSFLPVRHPSIQPLKVATGTPRAGAAVECIGFGGIKSELRHYHLQATDQVHRLSGGGRVAIYDGCVLEGDSGAALLNDAHEVVGIMAIGVSPVAYIGQWPVLSPTGAATHADVAAFCHRVQCGPGGCGTAPVRSGWDQAYPPGPGTVPPPRITTPACPPGECKCELAIGSVETLPAGSPATATLRKEGDKFILDLGLPCGADGAAGLAGAPGEKGEQGTAVVNISEITQRVVEAMPPPKGFTSHAIAPVKSAEQRKAMAAAKGSDGAPVVKGWVKLGGKEYAVLDSKQIRPGGDQYIFHDFDVKVK